MKRITDSSELYFVFLMEHFGGILNRKCWQKNSEETYLENNKSAKTGEKLKRGKLSKASFG